MPVLIDPLEIGAELQRRLDPAGRSLVGQLARYAIEASPALAYRFATRPPSMQVLVFAPRVECADGLSFSAQADATLFCAPRNSVGPWQAVEVALPSRPVARFEPYRMYDNEPECSVYGYVPLGCVVEVIVEAGGLLHG